LASLVSKGNQTKYWVGNYLVKLDSPGWYESIAEVLVSELQSWIKNPLPYVDYEYLVYRDTPACRCKNFLKEGESVISLKKALDLTRLNIDYSLSGAELKSVITGVINMEYGLNIEKYLSYMVYLDALVLNEDRHLRNISFIKDVDDSLKLSPLYDFGLSLMSDVDAHPNWKDVSGVRCQPFASTFEEQTKLFENPHIVIDYNGLRDKLFDVLRCSSEYVGIEKVSSLRRAIRILLERLDSTEGLLWFRVV
jgi:hypothetical protein